MNEQGITWNVVAAYFKTNTTKLREQLKTYEKSTERVYASNDGGRKTK